MIDAALSGDKGVSRSGSLRLTEALVVLGATIGIIGGFGILFPPTFAVMLKPISADLGWSRATVGLMSSLAFLGYAIGAPVMGRLNDTIGAFRTLAIGIAGVTGGMAALAYVPGTLTAILPVCFVMGFAGAANAPTGYVLILSKWFGKNLGKAIGFAMLGVGIAVVAIPGTTQAVVAALGWRQTYLVLAAIALVLGLVALGLGVGRVPPKPVASTAAATPDVDGATLADALRSWRYWLIGVTALIISGASFGAGASIASALTDKGIDAATAAFITGLGGAGLFIGRIAVAFLMDRFFVPYIAMICCLLGSIGLIMVPTLPADALPLLGLAAILAGLLLGSEGDTLPYVTRRYFGVRHFGSIFGSLVTFIALGGLVGPVAYGLGYDLTGSYAAIYFLAAAGCAISGVAILLLGPYRYDVESRAMESGGEG